MAKQLILNPNYQRHMLIDPAFYDKCPAFEYLRDTGLATAEEYKKTQKNGCCGGDATIMRGVVAAFMLELTKQDPATIETIKVYIAGRKGWRPEPLVFFHKYQDGKPPARYEV